MARASRRKAAGIAGSIALLVALAAAVPFTPVMPVNGVQVEGNHTLDAQHVEELTGIAEGTPMGRVDVHKAAEGVASDPWVKSVTVQRDWPSTVDVTVEEHAAVAYIKRDDGAHLIDADGKEFLNAEPPADAIELVGAPEGDEEALRGAVAVASSISERARGQISAIQVGKYTYELRTADGRKIIWGAPEDNANKALALETVLQMDGREFNISNPQLVTSR